MAPHLRERAGAPVLIVGGLAPIAAVAEGRLHPDVIISRCAAWRDAAEVLAEPTVKLVVERDAA